jgi:hypothetical protein
MGPHPGPKIIAADHNIKDIPWKKLFPPSTNSFVSPNESVSPNGRDCITYRKRYDPSPVAGQPDAFLVPLQSKTKRDSTANER